MVGGHALDIERERARRLVDRFGRNALDSGELAREKRARQVSAGFRKEIGDGVNKATTARAAALQLLESQLHVRRQQQLNAMFLQEGRVAPQVPQPPFQARCNLTCMTSQTGPMQMPAQQVEAARVPSSVQTFPREVTMRRQEDDSMSQTLVEHAPRLHTRDRSVFESLKDALEEISVKSILDFRSYGSGNRAAELVATAAVCAIANIDSTVRINIHSLDPDCPWPDALTVFNKPGHFINSLRRFPDAVDTNKVPEVNIVAARHYADLATVETDADTRTAALGLQHWIESAISYWDAHSLGSLPEEDDDDIAEDNAAQHDVEETPLAALLGRTAPVKPAAVPPVVQDLRPATSSLSGTSSATQAKPPTKTEPHGLKVEAHVVKARPAASPQPRRAPTVTQPSQPTPTSAPTARLPGNQQSRSSVTTRERPRGSPRTVSPNPSPRPQRPPPAGVPPRHNTVTSQRPSAGQVATAADKAVPPAPGRSPTRAAPRPGCSPRRSPTRAPPAEHPPGDRPPGPRLSVSKSSSSLCVSKSSPAVRAPAGAQQGQVAVPRSKSPGVNATNPQALQQFRKMLEEKKKEVREIRAIESKMKWNMQREERKDTVHQAKAVEEDIRDWRWHQSDEMKAYVEEKALQTKLGDLQESKEFQEFKREIKALEKEEDQQYITEMYLQDVENASWRTELAHIVGQRDKEIIADRREDVQHFKDFKLDQRLQEKVEEEEHRAIEQSLEMANLTRQLEKEKEQLLQSLQFTRQCNKKPLVGNGSGSRASSVRRPY